MNKGQFVVLTAALGLVTLAGAGYVGFAHAASGHPGGSGASGVAVAGGGQGSPVGVIELPTDGSSDAAGSAGAGVGAGASSPGSGSSLSASGAQSTSPVPECGPGEIQVSQADGGASAGHESLLIEFTNVGKTACYLKGYPGASIFGPNSDKSLLDATRTLVGPAGGATGVSSPQRVVLQVDGAASAIVEWSDVPSGSASCMNPVSLGVTPPDSKQTTTISMSAQVCSGFEVHPVVQGLAYNG